MLISEKFKPVAIASIKILLSESISKLVSETVSRKFCSIKKN